MEETSSAVTDLRCLFLAFPTWDQIRWLHASLGWNDRLVHKRHKQRVETCWWSSLVITTQRTFRVSVKAVIANIYLYQSGWILELNSVANRHFLSFLPILFPSRWRASDNNIWGGFFLVFLHRDLHTGWVQACRGSAWLFPLTLPSGGVGPRH